MNHSREYIDRLFEGWEQQFDGDTMADAFRTLEVAPLLGPSIEDHVAGLEERLDHGQELNDAERDFLEGVGEDLTEDPSYY